jgi:hypothetical protein
MQVLFTLPEMTQCYSQNRFFERGDLAHPDTDLGLQLGKLCRGLLSGDYSLGPDRQGWKKPGFLKNPAQCVFLGLFGFFWVFGVLGVFWGIFGFFKNIYLPRRRSF